MSASNGFDDLPPPAKLGLGGTALAAIAFMGYLINGHPMAAIILLAGLVLVVLLVIAWGKLGSLKQKSHAKVFSSDLSAQLKSTPQGVVKADSRAKLDDLRRKLQEGFDKLSSTGKSPYVLPWYLMVGEPGSGKTKALAAANIALPGFQDPLQGTGGTVNMNWWFTNNGIILDTAGRLMLPEVPTTNNPEWDEFLGTLSKKRPDCPVNGLLLAIPADTLITDSEEKIYRKAGEIAVQFNKVQAMLGIRFPVFVLITKCDKILGFREFFESLSSPEEQAQMLGWSNPNKLDEPFRPELVEQHLQSVHEQLIRRRLRLIQDPVHTEDPTGRRLDQVDALYELPDSLLAIAPRLRRYLEPIFVAGPLSSRPLFLRGIYFTSSLQTGEAVDKAISAIMGVDIVSSHGGPVVGEKPYFLRHVFQEKVFKEKGLVTRTDNVAQLKRRRKLGVIAAGFASAMALVGLTWVGKKQLNQRIEAPTNFWTNVDKARAKEQSPLNFIGSDGLYRGDQPIDTLGMPLVKVHDQAIQQDGKAIKVPPVFAVVATSSSFDPNKERRSAYRDLYESTVIQPLVSRAEDKIIGENTWSPAATTALRQLMLIEAGAKLDPSRYSDNIVPVTPLADYVLSKEDLQKYNDSRDVWENGFKSIYLSEKDRFDWPPAVNDPKRIAAINEGTKKFEEFVDQRAAEEAKKREVFTRIAKSLTDIDRAEGQLLNIQSDPKGTFDGKNSTALKDWAQNARSMDASVKDLTADLGTLKNWKPQGNSPGLADHFQRTLNDDQKALQARYDYLITGVLDQLPSNAPPDLVSIAKRLRSEKDQAGSVSSASQTKGDLKTIGELEGRFLQVDRNGSSFYTIHNEIVQQVSKQIPTDSAAVASNGSEFTDMHQKLAGIDDARNSTKKFIDDKVLPFVSANASPEKKLGDSAESLLETAMARKRSLAIEAVFKDLPATENDWKDKFKTATDPRTATLPLTKINKTRFPDPEYDPDQYTSIKNCLNDLKSYAGLSGKIRQNPELTPILDYKSLSDQYDLIFSKAWADYEKTFGAYWDTGILEEIKPGTDLTWDQVQADVKEIDPVVVNKLLESVEIQQAAALNRPKPRAGMEKLTSKVKQRLAIWKDLEAKQLRDARDSVLGEDVDVFGNNYLIDSESQDLAEQYWNGVFNAAFKAMADECGKNTDQVVQALKGLKKFPLSPTDNGPGLTLLEIKEVQKLLDQAIPANPPAARTIASSGGAKYPDLAAAIDKMKGSKAAKELDGENHWTSEVRPLVDALAGDKLKCHLTIVPVNDVQVNGKDTIRHGWRAVSVALAGENPVFVPPLPTDGPDRNRDTDLPSMKDACGKDFQLLLYEKADDPIPKKVTLGSGNWPYLRLMQKGALVPAVGNSIEFDVDYFVDGQYLARLKLVYTPTRMTNFKFPVWISGN